MKAELILQGTLWCFIFFFLKQTPSKVRTKEGIYNRQYTDTMNTARCIYLLVTRHLHTKFFLGTPRDTKEVRSLPYVHGKFTIYLGQWGKYKIINWEHILFSKSQIYWEVNVLAHREKQWLIWIKEHFLEKILLSGAPAVTDAYGSEEGILRKHRPGFCERL